MRNLKKYTIKEIAEYTGVAPSTVSRVLNNTVTSIPVTEKTKKKILSAVKKFDYSPNINAKRLSGKKTFVLGLQIPAHDISSSHAFSDHTLVETMRGIEDAIKDSEYKLLIIFKNDEYLRLFREKTLDGLMIWGENDKSVYKKEILDYPAVFLNSRPAAPENINFIAHDNYHAGFMITEYLIKKGSGKFLYISAPELLSIAKERKSGFLAALEKYSIKIDRPQIIEGDYTVAKGFEIMDKILTDNTMSFDTVLCINDSMALGVYQAALKHGKKIPRDFSLAGGDGVDLFGENYFPLTTFKVDCFGMGRRAVQWIFELLRGENTAPRMERLATELVIRGTA